MSTHNIREWVYWLVVGLVLVFVVRVSADSWEDACHIGAGLARYVWFNWIR